MYGISLTIALYLPFLLMCLMEKNLHNNAILRTAGVASGYAPGQIKICILPQATPKAFYCTIFAFRGICKFSFAFRLCPGHSLSTRHFTFAIRYMPYNYPISTQR
ncbi:hypothetical protein T01_12531 [Trichinella spiralis]|uniref:Uncharacterized protein n=1 Tax=Trichinella spiralis TaxID=6334 RepID=A0A0V1B4Q7_TRISP|nr:hypothetical protein T01_12531 [Trichinella spiralis]